MPQHYPNIEHIVVDGSSTDGTLEILLSYPHLRVISERDCAMYDALNKGIAIARGEIIGLINTDDLYEVGAFDDVAEVFVNHPGVDVVIGRAVVFEGVPSKKSCFEECPHLPLTRTAVIIVNPYVSFLPVILRNN